MYFMSNKKVAVLVFASLAGVTLFLFQNCSAASQIVLRSEPSRADDLSDVLDKSSSEIEHSRPARRNVADEAALGERLKKIIINDHQDISEIQKRVNDNKMKSAHN